MYETLPIMCPLYLQIQECSRPLVVTSPLNELYHLTYFSDHKQKMILQCQRQNDKTEVYKANFCSFNWLLESKIRKASFYGSVANAHNPNPNKNICTKQIIAFVQVLFSGASTLTGALTVYTFWRISYYFQTADGSGQQFPLPKGQGGSWTRADQANAQDSILHRAA